MIVQLLTCLFFGRDRVVRAFLVEEQQIVKKVLKEQEQAAKKK